MCALHIKQGLLHSDITGSSDYNSSYMKHKVIFSGFCFLVMATLEVIGLHLFLVLAFELNVIKFSASFVFVHWVAISQCGFSTAVL